MLYRRKRKKGRIVFAICLLLLLVGFTYGYISNNKPLNKPDNISELDDNNDKDVRKVNENKVVEDSKREDDETGKGDVLERGNKVKVDSEIVFNTYYVKTGGIDTKKTRIPITMSGATLNEFREYIEDNYGDWSLRSISVESASLFKQIDGYQPNHFIIQNMDGYIAIYKINEAGEKELYEKTEISISTLSEIDKKKLDKGIFLKSLEEVYSVIEDYSS